MIQTSKAGRVIMLTEEQEQDFNRLSLRIQQGNYRQCIPELLQVLGILDPQSARQLAGKLDREWR